MISALEPVPSGSRAIASYTYIRQCETFTRTFSDSFTSPKKLTTKGAPGTSIFPSKSARFVKHGPTV